MLNLNLSTRIICSYRWFFYVNKLFISAWDYASEWL